MKPHKVLIVEDNELNMELITDVLTFAGFEIVTAGNGTQALEIAASARPDIVLMDVQLPGMDGLEATRKLKANPETASIPVVAITSHAMKNEREAALEAGCAGYFPKLIDVSTLAENLKKFLP